METIEKQIDNLVKQRQLQVDAALIFLREEVEFIFNIELKQCCRDVLSDPRFQKCTAAMKKHQAYDGGLVVHTAEVLEVALNMAKPTCVDANRDILVTAVVFHDFGKIFDYQPPLPNEKEKYSYTTHQNLIRHLSRSYAEFMRVTEGKVSEPIREQIGHCILAHHGRNEWGSPAEPKTTEAYLIHFADMVSAFCTKDFYKR